MFVHLYLYFLATLKKKIYIMNFKCKDHELNSVVDHLFYKHRQVVTTFWGKLWCLIMYAYPVVFSGNINQGSIP